MSYQPTSAEVEAYLRNGYLVVPRPIFSPAKYEQLKEYTSNIFASHANPSGEQPPLIDCPHWGDPKMFEWLFADEMLDLVEPLIGPDIAVFACHLMQKPPSVGRGFPWHEDSFYWSTLLNPVQVASITIALSPATPDNGCLRIIAGSHLSKNADGYSDYVKVDNPNQQVFSDQIVPEQIDESKAVNIVLQPNQASIHDGKIIHGSAPNTGAIGRSCLTVRYFPTTVKFTRELFQGEFHVFLARGKDKAGNEYSNPNDTNRHARPARSTV
jgi:hypothetical protein